jgi:hypothetical protein
MRDDVPAVPVGPPVQPTVTGLDMTTFAQLITAIKQAGLTVNVDAIHSVCDREFRDGRYQRAFDVIEGISVQMGAQASRRQAELRQQELRYKSGALKMSPKEWMLRQSRETDKTQKIERARRHCARILDGLNSLRAATAEKPSEDAPPETKQEDQKP